MYTRVVCALPANSGPSIMERSGGSHSAAAGGRMAGYERDLGMSRSRCGLRDVGVVFDAARALLKSWGIGCVRRAVTIDSRTTERK